ncbi:MAG: type IX secretion system membrane protein PorP/SprF [Bacteroidetes bacterium]|nr:type IX secretion system membrane protein PorP/SprF [Bacteroidota bacterium]
MKRIKNNVRMFSFLTLLGGLRWSFLLLFFSLLFGEGWGGSSLYAQQLPHYSNYMLNNFVMNPAVAGTNPYFEGLSNNRYQWIGITDAPRTYILSVNGPTKSLNVGLGGLLFTDIVGPTRRTGFYLSYAYHIKVAEKVKLSFGLSGGILQFMVDASKITLKNPIDQVISTGLQSVIAPDFGVGIYAYSTDKKWYAGASMPQILQNRINFYETASTSLSKLATHFYITGGYKYQLNENFTIEPSALIKFVKPAPVQFDLGVRAIYREKIWLGAAYRNLDAVSAMVGYTMQENLTFAYSYDFTTSNIRKYSTGTHEFMIGIKFYKVEKTESVETVKEVVK